MQKYSEFLLEKEGKQKPKPVVLSFGRMNPIHTGHEKVINKVHEIAKRHKAKHVIVLSHNHDAVKNPLPPESKLKYLQHLYPNTNFSLADKKAPSIIQAAERLHQMGYTHLHVVAGSDRGKEYKQLLNKYNGPEKNFNFQQILVHSSGARNPDKEGTEGMSASKMRGHAKLGNFEEFAKGVPGTSTAIKKKMYNEVRENMGLKENASYGDKIALFLVGPPGSGKDRFANQLINEYDIVERNFQQVTKNNVIFGKNILINGPANEYSMVEETKKYLERYGYNCSMIFVNVSNEESEKRNVDRCGFGKLIKEEARLRKWEQSQINIEQFEDLFQENFLYIINELFDRSYPFTYDNSTPVVKNLQKAKKAKPDNKRFIPVTGTRNRVIPGVGIGPTVSMRANGAASATMGLVGDPQYNESIDSPSSDMPATGYSSGAANKEPMTTPGQMAADRCDAVIPDKKKKRFKDLRNYRGR